MSLQGPPEHLKTHPRATRELPKESLEPPGSVRKASQCAPRRPESLLGWSQEPLGLIFESLGLVLSFSNMRFSPLRDFERSNRVAVILSFLSSNFSLQSCFHLCSLVVSLSSPFFLLSSRACVPLCSTACATTSHRGAGGRGEAFR